MLDKPSYDTSLLSQRRSSADCLISYDGNLYSVPAGYHRQLLLVRETEQNELLIYTTQGEEIARHRLSQGYNLRIVEPVHYQGITQQTARSAQAAASQLVLAESAGAVQIVASEVETRPLSLYEALAAEVWA